MGVVAEAKVVAVVKAVAVARVDEAEREAKAAACVGTGQKDTVGGTQESAGFRMVRKRAEERRCAGTSLEAIAPEARTAGSLTREKPRRVHKERPEEQTAVRPTTPRQQHQVPQRYEKQRWSPRTPHGDGQNQSGA